MKKILLISHDIPSMTVGATLPLYHLIRNIGEKNRIHLICFDSGKYSVKDLKPFLYDTDTISIPEYLDVKNQLIYTLKNMICADNLKTHSFLNYYYHKDMNQLIREKYQEYDLIITDMPMAFYAGTLDKDKIVYAFDAVSDYNYNMYRKADTYMGKIYWYLNYTKIHRYEQVYNRFNACILVNDKDKELLEREIHIPIEVVANGVDTEYFKNKSVDKTARLVFLGDMSTPPNNDAVKYFVEEIYPGILDEKPVDLYIVGRNPTSYIKSLESKHVHVTGSVDDVRDYMPEGSIFITPMISGTGIKNKILEAMSMNLPVITTSKGISGINAQNRVEYLLADTPDEFIRCVLELLNNPELKYELGKNARLFVEKEYSWKKSSEKIEEIIMKYSLQPPSK